MSTVRFIRCRACAAFALLLAGGTFAVLPQTPTFAQTSVAPASEPPAPVSVTSAITEAEKLRDAKKFAEAIVVLEARQKALGANITESEKRSLLLRIADIYLFWANEARAQHQNQEIVQHLQSAYEIDKTYRLKGATSDLINIGGVYHVSGDKTKALEFYNKALPLAQAVGDKSNETSALNRIGMIYNDLGDKTKALDFYNKALPLARAIGDKRWEAITLNNTGIVYDSLGDKTKAIEAFNKALPILQAVGDKNNESVTLSRIGGIYYESGELSKALDFYNQVLSLRRELGDKREEGYALNNIASVYQALGENAKALDYFNKNLLLMQQIGDKRVEAITLDNMGVVYSALGENAKALDSHNKALQLFQSLDDKAGETSVLSRIGEVYRALGENTKALDSFNKALPILRDIGDKKGEASTFNGIGSVYYDLGDKTNALDFYNKALLLLQAVGDKWGAASILNNIGKTYSFLGEYAQAIDVYNKALPLFQAVGDKRREATTLANMGAVYSFLGENTKALDFYNKALQLSRDVGDKNNEAATLNSIGALYTSLDDKTKALDYFNKALQLVRTTGSKQDEVSALTGIGSVYSSLGDKTKALDYLNRALSLSHVAGDKADEALTLTDIGFAYYSLGENAPSIDFYNKALPLFQALGDKRNEAITADNLMQRLADAKNPLRNPALAVTFGKQSVNLYQTLRANIQTIDKGLRTTFTKTVEPTYRRLADILIAQGRLPEAQQVLDLLKDQEFSDFLRRDATLVAGTPQADLTSREAAVKKRYDTAGAKITAAAAEFDKVSREMRLEPTDARKARLAELNKQLDDAQAEFLRVLDAITAEFQAAKPADSLDKLKTVQETENLTATLGTLSEQTGRNAVAVYTLVAPERLHCLVVTPSAQIARTTEIKDSELNKLVADFRTALQNPNLDPRPLGKKLYDILIAPIAADLKGANAKSILWSLDGTLRYIPLAALSPDGQTYLAQQPEQSSLFTPATLLNLKDDDTEKNNWKAAAFGVTTGRKENGVTFGDLPSVFEEIDAVSQIVPTQSFVDAAFTEDAFRSALVSRPPLVHIASHFSFKPGNPAASFLLLGKGTLSLDTIARSRVNLFDHVALLTLSACDTATGNGANENGAEVESFALLAQKKGAKAVLASLWPINDESTQLFMQTFYAIHKAHPNLGKAECLRQTQVALLNGTVKASPSQRGAFQTAPPAGFIAFVPNAKTPYAHPFYWAAFTLIGNTK